MAQLCCFASPICSEVQTCVLPSPPWTPRAESDRRVAVWVVDSIVEPTAPRATEEPSSARRSAERQSFSFSGHANSSPQYDKESRAHTRGVGRHVVAQSLSLSPYLLRGEELRITET